MKLLSNKQTEANLYELEIQVEKAEFAEGIDQSYKKNAPKLSLHGFRKGKAPRSMVMKMVGEEYFYEDAVNLTYYDAYEKAVEEAGLEPVDSPDVELKDLSAEGYTFLARVTNKPVVELEGYKGLKATRPVTVVTDEEIQDQLEGMADRNSRLAAVTDRAAQEGDTAEIDFEGFLDGVAFPGGKGEGHPLVLGSNQFIPGFEEKIVGHQVGEEFDIDVTFPEEYHEESLRGKDVVFHINLRSLKVKELPAIDDELAKDVSDFDTLEELKADLRQKSQERKEQAAKEQLENSLVDAAAELAKVEIPQVMVDRKTSEMMEDFARQLQSQGLNLETYLQYTGATPETFQESFAPRALQQVKATLTLEKITQLEGLEATDEEVEAEYQKTADAYNMEVDRIKALISRHSLEHQLRLNKAIDLLVQHAEITDEAPQGEAAAKKPAAKKAAAKKPAAKKAAAKAEDKAEDKAESAQEAEQEA